MPTSKQRKPKKPRPDFPLFYHQTGQWAKKVRGKVYYFGVDATAAEEKWLREKDHLLAGKPRPTTPDGLTLRELVNQFLTRKKEHVDSGELSSRTWSGYYTSCESLLEALGKQIHVADLTPEDFAKYRARLARRFGPPVAQGRDSEGRTLFRIRVGRVHHRSRCGSAARSNQQKTVRKAIRAGPDDRAADLRQLVEAAGVQMRDDPSRHQRAFGQTDVAGLPVRPRPQTRLVVPEDRHRRRCLVGETLRLRATRRDDRPTSRRVG